MSPVDAGAEVRDDLEQADQQPLQGGHTLAEPRPCEVCGRSFRPRVTQLRKGHGRICSIACVQVRAHAASSVRFAHEDPIKARSRFVQTAPDATPREKARAKRHVNEAVKSGRLVRPSTCARCGRIAAVEGHHADYAKTLDVEWLCVSCHRKAHLVLRGDAA
jgi:hypothetical protein